LKVALTISKEFATLADEANIYKLVGPVLLKQDATEARSTVDGRLEYIEKEMYAFVDPFDTCSDTDRNRKRIEGQIAGIQDKTDAKKMEVSDVDCHRSSFCH